MQSRNIIFLTIASAMLLIGGTDIHGRRDTLTIRIMGDMMMHKEQIGNAQRKDSSFDFSQYFKHIKDLISSADIAIANLEFTLAGEPYSGYPAFSAPDAFAEHIASSGFDIFLTANNHIFDKGSIGAGRTIEVYRALKHQYGIEMCGIYADQQDYDNTCPLMVTRKGFIIALLNCTYGTNLGRDLHWPKVTYMNERTIISHALKKAQNTDFTLVLPHWGTEYSLQQSESQRSYAIWLGEQGADMVIGSHPHVPQGYEILSVRSPGHPAKDIQVAYSLGNAVSNMSAANTQLGLLATVRLVRDESGHIRILPIEFTYLWCSRPGGFNGCSYTVLPVTDYLDKRELWQGKWDYDKMKHTYHTVKDTIGIEEN